jgi:hypothetical protein
MTSFGYMKRGIIFVLTCLLIVGCKQESEPSFVGKKYAWTLTGGADALQGPGNLSLYYFPNGHQGEKVLVWPYLTAGKQVAMGDLAVFNGGLSDDRKWKGYPALLAYTGSGCVVEISAPVSRQIEGWIPAWTNYSFELLPATNGLIRFDAMQIPPIDWSRPKRFEVVVDKTNIVEFAISAQTSAPTRMFGKNKYCVAP